MVTNQAVFEQQVKLIQDTYLDFIKTSEDDFIQPYETNPTFIVFGDDAGYMWEFTNGQLTGTKSVFTGTAHFKPITDAWMANDDD